MANLQGKWFRILLAGLLAFVMIGWFIVPFVSFQIRLARNGKIAQQLVESLETHFPGMRFRGGASYEREVIYIAALDRLDASRKQEVERWLRKQKTEQNIAPQIRLRFADDGLDSDIILQ